MVLIQWQSVYLRITAIQQVDVDVAASFVTSGNGGYGASTLSSPNNSEEPLPPELHSPSVPTQVSVTLSTVTCLHGSM